MISEDIEALALADAAGALEPEEQRELLQRIATLAPDDRERVARLYDIAETLEQPQGKWLRLRGHAMR